MPATHIPLIFSATGTIQTCVMPETGDYLIEATGAQGGAGGGPGGKGARVTGIFPLSAGDILQIVVGQQGTPGTMRYHPAGGGGGGSFVWKGDSSWPLPPKPLLAAGGGGGGTGSDGGVTLHAADGGGAGGHDGHGGAAALNNFYYNGGGGAGWLSAGTAGSAPTYCQGGGHWSGGLGASYCGNQGADGGFGGGGGGGFIGFGSGGGGGFSGGGGGTQKGPGGGGGGSYNGGTECINLPGIQLGDGCVRIMAVVAPLVLNVRSKTPSPLYRLHPMKLVPGGAD